MQTRRTIRQKVSNLSDRTVLTIVIGMAALSSVMSLIINGQFQIETTPAWWVNWLTNLSTEMFGAFLTFWLIQGVMGKRQEKERLIRQMRSRDNGLALQAVGELGAAGWLTDGSLNDANLWKANLYAVRMWDADLQGVDLHGANLAAANLERVNLTGANLWNTSLEGIIMTDVNLEGADLFSANLNGARLWNVEFDEKTRLPDGSYWNPASDLARFGIVDEAPPIGMYN